MQPVSQVLSVMLVGCVPVFCLRENILGFCWEYFIYNSVLRVIQWGKSLQKHQRAVCSRSKDSVHVFVCK